MTCNQFGILLEFGSLVLLIWREKICEGAVTAGMKSFLIERGLQQSKFFNPTDYIARKLADHFNSLIFGTLILGMAFQFFG